VDEDRIINEEEKKSMETIINKGQRLLDRRDIKDPFTAYQLRKLIEECKYEIERYEKAKGE